MVSKINFELLYNPIIQQENKFAEETRLPLRNHSKKTLDTNAPSRKIQSYLKPLKTERNADKNHIKTRN